MNLCLRIKAPRLSLTMSQPAEAVWKQQLQKFDLLGWIFQRWCSFDSYIFFRPVPVFVTRKRNQFLLMVCGLQCSSNSIAIAKLVRFVSQSVNICFFFFSKIPAFHYLLAIADQILSTIPDFAWFRPHYIFMEIMYGSIILIQRCDEQMLTGTFQINWGENQTHETSHSWTSRAQLRVSAAEIWVNNIGVSQGEPVLELDSST